MVGWGKQAILQLSVSISRKMQEIRPKLLFMTNRKLHMRFRLTPRSMTLDDLQLLVWIFKEFLGISQISDATTAKRIKIDQYCQRQRCKHIELEQFLACFSSRGFVSDSWAFLFSIVTTALTLTIRSQFAIECLRRSNQLITLGQNFGVFPLE